jgi:hypothetical protein
MRRKSTWDVVLELCISCEEPLRSQGRGVDGPAVQEGPLRDHDAPPSMLQKRLATFVQNLALGKFMTAPIAA